MSCKYCEELSDYLKFNNKQNSISNSFEEDEHDISLTELHFKYLGFDSRWQIPVHFCPSCGEKIN